MAENEEQSRQNRELLELLNELRVILPGVTVLFGFLLTLPFGSAFGPPARLGQPFFYFLAFLSSAAASAFLIAPSLYHRLHFRRDVRDKEAMLQLFNKLVLAGGALLALSMTCTIYLVTDRFFGDVKGAVVAGAAALLFGLLWFALPLWRGKKEIARVDAPVAPPP